jgi:hypothetical protein
MWGTLVESSSDERQNPNLPNKRDALGQGRQKDMTTLEWYKKKIEK